MHVFRFHVIVSKLVEIGGEGGRREVDGREVRGTKRKKLLFSRLKASIANNSGICTINGSKIIQPISFSRSLFALPFPFPLSTPLSFSFSLSVHKCGDIFFNFSLRHAFR